MFERNRDTYTMREQLRLFRARVAVCGLGGTGGYVAETLARAGVGTLILIDGDHFEDSNRNRQIGALGSTLGRNKALVMAERLRDANPFLTVSAHPVFISDATRHLLDDADLVCDCVDGRNKLILAALCRETGKPYSTGGLSGRSFKAGLFDDPRLGERAYNPSPAVRPSLQAEQASLLCCAAMQASETLLYLAGRESPARNRLIRLDLANARFSLDEPADTAAAGRQTDRQASGRPPKASRSRALADAPEQAMMPEAAPGSG